MNPILLAQALVVVIILPAFAAWAQDTGISLPDLSSLPPLGSRTEHFQRNDDVLKKIIDGKYSPEIYRVNDDDDDEKRLSKQQINCLYAECAMFQARFEQGAGTLDALVVDARRRLGDAKLEFHVEPEEQRKVLTEQLEDAKKLESSIADRVLRRVDDRHAAYKAAYLRIKAELALLRFEKAQAKKSTKTSPPVPSVPREHSQQNDDVFKEIIDGKYAPEIYRVNDDDDDENRLSKQQINCHYAECVFSQALLEIGAKSGTIELLLDAQRRLADAKLKFHVEPEEQRKLLTEKLEIERKLESYMAAKVFYRIEGSDALSKAAYFRIKAELALLRFEKAQAKKSTAPPTSSRPWEHSQQIDNVLQEIVDGKYSPEIYRVNDDDDDEKRLLKQQINCRYAECVNLQTRLHRSGSIMDALVDARRRLGDAKLEFHVEPEEQREVLTEQLEDAKKAESSTAERMSMRVVGSVDGCKAAYFRIKAELALLRFEKAQPR